MVHLCEEHARVYPVARNGGLPPTRSLAGMLAKQTENSSRPPNNWPSSTRRPVPCVEYLCRIPAIGQAQLRLRLRLLSKRLGTAAAQHPWFEDARGKRPTRRTGAPDRQHELIQLRREMQEAIAKEQYEKAGELRDKIQKFERGDGPNE